MPRLAKYSNGEGKNKSSAQSDTILVVLHTRRQTPISNYIPFHFISASQKTAVQWRAAALNGVLQFYFTYMQNEAGMFILISHAANNGTKTNKLPQNDSVACDTLSHENMLVNGKNPHA